jgi:hypothetical protein
MGVLKNNLKIFSQLISISVVLLGVVGCGTTDSTTSNAPTTSFTIPTIEITPTCAPALLPTQNYLDTVTEFNNDVRLQLNVLMKPAYNICTYLEYSYFVNTVITPWARQHTPRGGG